jgi:hypothetical protein
MNDLSFRLAHSDLSFRLVLPACHSDLSFRLVISTRHSDLPFRLVVSTCHSDSPFRLAILVIPTCHSDLSFRLVVSDFSHLSRHVPPCLSRSIIPFFLRHPLLSPMIVLAGARAKLVCCGFDDSQDLSQQDCLTARFRLHVCARIRYPVRSPIRITAIFELTRMEPPVTACCPPASVGLLYRRRTFIIMEDKFYAQYHISVEAWPYVRRNAARRRHARPLPEWDRPSLNPEA